MKITDDHPNAPRPTRPAEVVDLAAVRARKAAVTAGSPRGRVWVQWGAIAACVAIGVIVARGLGAAGAAPMIGDEHGTLMAKGALSQALDQQIAGAPAAPDEAVKIGVSFRTGEKMFCRAFQVVRSDGLAGLACRAPRGWQVRVAAASPSHGVSTSSHRTAAPALPPTVGVAVDAMIEGAPLDAAAEAAAKAKGWRE